MSDLLLNIRKMRYLPIREVPYDIRRPNFGVVLRAIVFNANRVM